jgi:hypothetical protein
MGNKMVPNPKKQGTGNINYTTNTTGTYSWDDISQTD